MAMLVVAIVATGCMSSSRNSSSDPSDRSYRQAEVALERYASSDSLRKGPYGKLAQAESIQLSEDEIAKVRDKNATAAIVMHLSGGDSWSIAQVDGLRKEFSRLGIEVIAVTQAESDPAKQVSDIESVLARKPDIIVSVPIDLTATAKAYQEAAEAGVELVFMDNPPNGMQPKDDYVSVVSTDNRALGAISAHQMADALGGSGKVGMLVHAAEFPTNIARADGFRETIASEYPDIEIVESKGLLGPDWSSQGEAETNGMLLRHPDLGGVWCFFAVPCEGAIAGARSADRDDLAVTSVDLGENLAVNMASKGMVTGIAAAQPQYQGVIEARLAAYGLLDKPAPPYVGVRGVPVTRDNLLKAWRTVYKEPPPPEVRQAFDNAG
jgi:ribose transport system substrate-binding protein